MSSNDNECIDRSHRFGPLWEGGIQEKLASVEEACQWLSVGKALLVPELPAREIEVVDLKAMPKKAGLASLRGQGQMFHDLASIELQAVELGLRTLAEFPNAPVLFREQLQEIVLEEKFHLEICLKSLEELGHSWGDWPVNLGLWRSTSASDDLLDRIFIVHRFLEGSGLDASEKLLRRLSGVKSKEMRNRVGTIAKDEQKHVSFGSHWYKKICNSKKLDADTDFGLRLKKLRDVLPKRLERVEWEVRKKCGFTQFELDELEAYRESLLAHSQSSS